MNCPPISAGPRTEIIPYSAPSAIGRIRMVTNVHQDDIHTITRLGDETLITGSKDGSLKKWSPDLDLVRVIYDPQRINYESWITATTKINDNYWLSGTRDGFIHFWNNSGTHCEELRIPVDSSHVAKSKQRNLNRIHCLHSFETQTERPLFLVGRTSQVSINTYVNPSCIHTIQTSENDWVYALQPIDDSTLLIATGCALDLVQKVDGEGWARTKSVIREPQGKQKKIGNERPYISAITPMEAELNYGISLFDGSVRIVDLVSNKTIYKKTEHEHRVWTIETLSANVFASCGDEGFIKLWDSRLNTGSVATIKDNEKFKARVSVLKITKEYQLLSGSCPDNLEETARLSQWDLRATN